MINTNMLRNCVVFLLRRDQTRSAILWSQNFYSKDQLDRSKATCSFNSVSTTSINFSNSPLLIFKVTINNTVETLLSFYGKKRTNPCTKWRELDLCVYKSKPAHVCISRHLLAKINHKVFIIAFTTWAFDHLQRMRVCVSKKV